MLDNHLDEHLFIAKIIICLVNDRHFTHESVIFKHQIVVLLASNLHV